MDCGGGAVPLARALAYPLILLGAEIKYILAFLEWVLLHALPVFLLRIDAADGGHPRRRLPSEPAPNDFPFETSSHLLLDALYRPIGMSERQVGPWVSSVREHSSPRLSGSARLGAARAGPRQTDRSSCRPSPALYADGQGSTARVEDHDPVAQVGMLIIVQTIQETFAGFVQAFVVHLRFG